MVEVADGEVLSAVELEVPAPQAEHHPTTLDAGGPHQGPAEDLAEVVEEQMPAVLGTLDDPRIRVRADGQSVRAIDPRLTEGVDGACDGVWRTFHVPVERDGLV